MSTGIYRQGDLLFIAVPELPDAVLTRAGNVIVEGEATGHSHRLLEGRILEGVRGSLFLEVFSATQVVHQEHRALELPPGFYRVIRQREYPSTESRTVRD